MLYSSEHIQYKIQEYSIDFRLCYINKGSDPMLNAHATMVRRPLKGE